MFYLIKNIKCFYLIKNIKCFYLISLGLFYYFIDHTLYIKAYLTFFLSIWSAIICYYSRNNFIIDQQGYGTLELNTFFKYYLIIDTFNHIIKNKDCIRKDLIIHHAVLLIPYILRPEVLGLSLCIMAEMYSTGALFHLSPQDNLFYRAVMIITVRMSIWIFLINESFNVNQDKICILLERYITSCILLLDIYWLKCIFTKLNNFNFLKN
jgi:hypothetical protein